ncbi:hypothetical protein [Sedimenticola hydrogenitrophicus]|uniref:hypothetical protein n=1 Tax=Sedimenticola hydrogenitrophicus TaxID=2967975 RepID=UPI0023AFE69B|nr:hypothetical protein [Sedimenticola hydrogenitrophicus]
MVERTARPGDIPADQAAQLRSGLAYTRQALIAAIDSLEEDLLDLEDVRNIIHAQMDTLDRAALGQGV